MNTIARAIHRKVSPRQDLVISGFRNFLLAHGRQEGTIARHEYCIKKFLELAKPDFTFEEATRQDLEQIIGQVRISGLAMETKRKIQISAKLLYKWLEGDGEYYPKKVAWIKTTITSGKTLLPEDLLTHEDIQNMVDAAKHPRDKAIISLLYDSGIRIGELLNMKIKDVEISTEPAHITIDGKTGMRKIPIIYSVPYVSQYLNYLSFVKDRNSPLWLTIGHWSKTGKPLGVGIRKMLWEVAEAAGIKKHIYPHLFRHSRATDYANKLTEAQLKMFFGWTADSGMASTYVHLSGRDIDNAVLYANGRASPEKVEAKPVDRICNRCKQINSISSIHCVRCGASLDIATTLAELSKEELIREILKNPEAFKDIMNRYKTNITQ